jgi:WD40 repeat protein
LATRAFGNVAFWNTGSWQTNGLFFPGTEQDPGFTGLGTVMSYSADSRQLAVSDWHQLHIRDAANPAVLVTTLVRRDGNSAMRVMSVAFSDSLLAVGYRDGVLALWDVRTWTELVSSQCIKVFFWGWPSLETAGGWPPPARVMSSNFGMCRPRCDR